MAVALFLEGGQDIRGSLGCNVWIVMLILHIYYPKKKMQKDLSFSSLFDQESSKESLIVQSLQFWFLPALIEFPIQKT